MNYIKTFIKRGLFGILAGVFVNQLIFFIIALKENYININSSIVISQFIISSIMGFYSLGLSVIFEVEEWSLLRQTITHAIMSLPFFPIAIYAGWMPSSFTGRIIFGLGCIIIYFIIWISIKRYWERMVEKLNEGLEKRNR